jgi:hypothetical protein
LIDRRDHPPFHGRIGAVQGRIIRDRADAIDGDGQRLVDPDAADHRHVAQDLDAEVRQQLARDGARGNARRRLPGARALEHVADVLEAVLESTGEVGVARARACHGRAAGARGFLGHLRLDVHRLLPVLPVLVRDEERNRAAGRLAPAYARQHLRAIGLDRHAAPAAVAALPPAKRGGHRVEIDRQPGRHAVDDRHERLSVRLTSGEKSQHNRNILYELSATSGRSAAPGCACRACARRSKVTEPARPARPIPMQNDRGRCHRDASCSEIGRVRSAAARRAEVCPMR